MALHFKSIVEFGLERSAEVLTQGFADYFVAIPFSAVGLVQSARSDSVDLAASPIVLRDDVPVAAALVSRRGWTSRLAAMALVPAARRQGIGRTTVMQLLADARSRGERAMVLEVIEQNEPAVRLYEACGFHRRRRLVGFAAKPAGAPAVASSLDEIDLRAMAADVTGDDLPWQISGETVANLTPPTLALRLDRAAVAVTKTAKGDIAIRSVAAPRTPEGIRNATQLLVALRGRFPENTVEIKAVWPEEMGDIFVAAGFSRTALTQWQMECRL